MADHSEKLNPKSESRFTNQNQNHTKNKKLKTKSEFEFCKVCKLNHNQGPRHKYFPNHRTALSAFLVRFQNNVNDVRFFLKDPTILRPEHADCNRFWCVFCDTDVDELDSSFACENAINHMAGAHHLKNLKHFLWQYGGKMEQLDKYRISETDLTKWEKKCESFKDEAVVAPIEGSSGVVSGASNDIHNNVNFEKTNNLEQNTLKSLNPIYSNVVLPLQYNTNEYQISNCRFLEVTNFGSNFHEHAGVHSNTTLLNWNDSSDSLSLTQVSSISTIDSQGNVHSGAPPPWLEVADQTLLNNQIKPALSSFMSSSKSQKSRKLNPKRVGAEKRKIELEKEKEKRGEIVET